MKKLIIITSIILTTAVTTFALTSKENKTEQGKVKIDNATGKATAESANAALATAD